MAITRLKCPSLNANSLRSGVDDTNTIFRSFQLCESNSTYKQNIIKTYYYPGIV